MKATLTIVCLVLAIFISTQLAFTSWHINQEINGWKDRAQVSSEPNDMLEWMTNVKEGMEKWDMVSGNAALFFPTPSTDMALIYHTVNQHIEQATVLTGMDRTSPQYQTGLDNLRGSIRELDIHAYQHWANQGGLLLSIGCWFSWIAFIVFGFWWLIEATS